MTKVKTRKQVQKTHTETKPGHMYHLLNLCVNAYALIFFDLQTYT